MPFPSPREHRIPLQAAAALTRRFRNSLQGGETATLFPREVFERLLGQPGAAGIRFYYGHDEAGAMRLIAVAVDGNGNDMTTAEIDDFGFPCPPVCGDGNELNQ